MWLLKLFKKVYYLNSYFSIAPFKRQASRYILGPYIECVINSLSNVDLS